MSNKIYTALVLVSIAFALLVADRMFRITPFLVREGFFAGNGPNRCGTDLPPCDFPKRCMNGFCRGTEQPQLYDRNPLPVVP